MSISDELAAEHLRAVRRMYDASPPEGCDTDGDRTPALRRVAASLAGGYSTLDLDPRDVRALVVVVDDAEGIIDALNGQASLLRGEANELRARVERLQARVDELESDAEMACEAPADDCDCSGCLTARERNEGAQ